MTIIATSFLTQIEVAFGPLCLLVGLTAATNVVYGIWLRSAMPDQAPEVANSDPQAAVASEQPSVTHSVSLALMLLDLVTLTAMLYFSGGANNPFAFLYFVNLAVGSMMIRPKFSWSLTLLAVAGYTYLLFYFVPVQGLGDLTSVPNHELRIVGQMLAFATCATVVTYYVTRTSGELHEQQVQLRHTQAANAANRRLEGLTTLAAGAAHELATPLSTIDVVVRELATHLQDVPQPDSVKHDLDLIESQLEMCRQILQRMRSAAGDSMAQQWNKTTIGELIDATLDGVRDPHRVDVIDGPADVESQPLWLPQEAVAQAIRNLIHNGLDAGDQNAHVKVKPELSGGKFRLSVTDTGSGMSTEVLGRVGDPFFTTKEPGRGIGLGLFLSRNVISRLGGDIEFRSEVGSGTIAIVTLPLSDQTPPNTRLID